MAKSKLGGERKISQKQFEKNIRKIEETRCSETEVGRSEGQECFRRCTRDNNHVGVHSFGSWCMR